MCAWTDTMMLAQWLVAAMSACEDSVSQTLGIRLAGALSLAALLAYASMANADEYLCVAEKASGFSFNKLTKSWQSANFSTEAKYLVSESNNPKYAYQVTGVWDRYPIASCKVGFNKYGYIFCADVGFGSGIEIYDFRFNRINGRFLLTSPAGYYNVVPEIDKGAVDENRGTPYMAIGKCSPVRTRY